MGYYVTNGRVGRYGSKGSNKKIWGFGTMNINLEENVEVLSEHYVNRFKFLLEGEMLNLQVKRHKDAYSIMQEYICNGEVEKDDYQWFYVNYQFKLQEEK